LKLDCYKSTFQIPYTLFSQNNMSQDNLIKMECSECRSINYYSSRNKKKVKTKLELKKYCAKCKKHVMHKETK